MSHQCRESSDPRHAGFCACGKKMTIGTGWGPEEIAHMREFDTGATRDTDEGKIDYEGFLSPLVIEAYGEYMHKHRVQSDGSLRASDNWQRGIPRSAYMKSMWRHFVEVWVIYRKPGRGDLRGALQTALCALLFNVMGYLHEELREDWDD